LRKITIALPCDFTGEELEQKGQDMSATMLEYDDVEERKKVSAKEFSEQMKELRGRMRSLSKQIRRKGEERAVECGVQMHNPTVGFKTIVRLDTGEIVKTEPMTDEERQDNLFEETTQLERMFTTPDTREQSRPEGEDAKLDDQPPSASGEDDGA
jgi:hypothetical protein